MKGYVLIAFLCFAPVCVAADIPQCVRITSALPAALADTSPDGFRIFQNQWIVNGSGVVFASSDKGASWRQILPKPPSIPSPSGIVGLFDGVLFAAPYSGNFIFESRNGVDWTIVPTPIPPVEFAAVGDLWVINGGENTVNLRMSRDAGHTWVQAPALEPTFPSQLDYSWQVLRTKSRILLTDSIDTGAILHTPPTHKFLTRVRRLSQNADRWEDVTPCACLIGFSLHGDFEGVFAGSEQGQLLVTNDAGATWSFRPDPEGPEPFVSRGAVVGFFSGPENTQFTAARFLYSSDAGVSWRSVGDGLPTSPGDTTAFYPQLFGVADDSLLVHPPRSTDLYSCSLR